MGDRTVQNTVRMPRCQALRFSSALEPGWEIHILRFGSYGGAFVVHSDFITLSVDAGLKMTQQAHLYRLNFDQVIHVSCLFDKQENTRSDHPGHVRQDPADVFP